MTLKQPPQKLYAVAYINFFDNNLEIEFVSAINEIHAVLDSKVFEEWDHFDCLISEEADTKPIPELIQEMKVEAFNSDCMFEVKEVEELKP